ncbi:MAG: hypothetical protein ACRDHY_12970 [Anaerolineales bacterium]
MEGGSANDYDYCSADPVNCTDLTGTYSYSYSYRIGRGDSDDAAFLMLWLRNSPNRMFPFKVSGGPIRKGARLCVYPLGGCDPVRVTSASRSSFTFTALAGHVEGAGGTIKFSITSRKGNLYFAVSARGPDTFTSLINPIRHLFAGYLWGQMAASLTENWRFLQHAA